jgi:glycosyltransferase involved in cell wall biosynthesis
MKVIVFTFAGCMGGVSSFNRNIINFAPRDPDLFIRVILLHDEQDTRRKFTDPIAADEVLEFHYSYLESRRAVFNRLCKLLGDEQGWIVTDNSLTLHAIRQCGTPKNVIHLVHDYYYIGVALDFAREIDACIAHSSFFKDILLAADIDIFQDKAHYIPYGVAQETPGFEKRDPGDRLRLVFSGRWEESKGVLLLKEIDGLLRTQGIGADWTILGSGSLGDRLKTQWAGSDNARFVTAKTTEEVYEILKDQDILVFPSKFEGTPVAIMEAMSRGVVPVTSDLPGGTRDMVTAETGFRCPPTSAADFANVIARLHSDRQLLKKLRDACLQLSLSHYDIKRAAADYFGFFKRVEGPGHPAGISGLKGLDNSFLPNALVYRFRKLKKRSTN